MLMDEPFASVDAQTRITLQEELNAIALATRKTILLVTHNVDEAVFLGDRCCVLSRRPGRVKTLVPVKIPRERRTWQLLTSDPSFAATKEQVLRLARVALARRGILPTYVGESLRRIVQAALVAVAVGVPAGVLLGMSLRAAEF